MHPESVKILNVRKARVKGTDMKAKKDFFNTTKIHKCTLKVHSKYSNILGQTQRCGRIILG